MTKIAATTNPMALAAGANPLAASRLNTMTSSKIQAQVTRMIWGSRISRSPLLKAMTLVQRQRAAGESAKQLLHGWMHQIEKWLGIQADPKDQEDQGNNHN